MWPFKPKPKRNGLRDIAGVIPSSIEFRRDPKANAAALDILKSPTGRMMLSILRHESPMRVGSISGAATDIQIVRAYGVQEGYDMALAALELLAEPAKDTTPITETFVDETQD